MTFSSQPSSSPTMPSHNTIWTVTARYFNDMTSEDGDLEVIGTYSSLEAANNSAQDLAAEEGRDALHEGLEPAAYFDQDGCFYFSDYSEYTGYEEGGTEIRVTPSEVQGECVSWSPASSPPRNSPYGPMVTIPYGKRQLRDAKFYFTGELSSMNRSSAMAAVDIYGGHIAESFDDVDYAVVGDGYHPEVHTIGMLGIEQINEATFHAILRNGVPWNKLLRHQCAPDSSRESTPYLPATARYAIAPPPAIAGLLTHHEQPTPTPTRPCKRPRL